jgi:hypothetical protein
MIRIVALAGAFLAALPVAAASEKVMVGNWAIEPMGPVCVASSGFGEPEDGNAGSLALMYSARLKKSQLVFSYIRPASMTKGVKIDLSVLFVMPNQDNNVGLGNLPFTIGGNEEEQTYITDPLSETPLDAFAKARALFFRKGDNVFASFALTEPAKVIAALRRCAADVIK